MTLVEIMEDAMKMVTATTADVMKATWEQTAQKVRIQIWKKEGANLLKYLGQRRVSLF